MFRITPTNATKIPAPAEAKNVGLSWKFWAIMPPKLDPMETPITTDDCIDVIAIAMPPRGASDSAKVNAVTIAGPIKKPARVSRNAVDKRSPASARGYIG